MSAININIPDLERENKNIIKSNQTELNILHENNKKKYDYMVKTDTKLDILDAKTNEIYKILLELSKDYSSESIIKRKYLSYKSKYLKLKNTN